MTKLLLTVNYDGGVVETPMTEWAPEEIKEMLVGFQLVDVESSSGPLRSPPRSRGCPGRAVCRCSSRSVYGG